MSRGACNDCGCAFEECECSERAALSKKARRPAPTTESATDESRKPWKAHGTFIQTYPCFKFSYALAPARAYDLLDAATKRGVIRQNMSCYTGGLEHDHVNRGWLINDGWVIFDINKDLGFVDVLANSRGRYKVYRAPLSSFIDLLRERIDTYSPLRHLYFDLTAPHEHA